MPLLSTSNTKIRKGEKSGYKTAGIHLAPHKLSGHNTCVAASKGCAAACLNTAGMGAYSTVQAARIKKTKMFFEDRGNFLNTLVKEIQSAIKKAKKNGMTPAFRLNLTSDIAWEKITINNQTIMEMFPDVNFYDYTKIPRRMLNFLNGKFPKNYHLTFSRSENNQTHADIVMGCGGNVAVVFRGKLPDTYKGKKVIDGDENDLRFLDPKGVIVGLVEKGKAKKDTSGFVVEPE
jgi:hypothetical protein